MANSVGEDVEQYIEKLRDTYLANCFLGRPAVVHPRYVEPDRRKQAKVVRELEAAGLVVRDSESESDQLVITARVLVSLAIQELDLITVWRQKAEQQEPKDSYCRPWIRVSELEPGQQKGLLENESVDYFVVATDAYSQWGKFAEERATVAETASDLQKYKQFWDGPFAPLAMACAQLREARGTCLAVSSTELRSYALSYREERHFEQMFIRNAPWGLVKTGLLPEHVIFKTSGESTINEQFTHSSFPFSGSEPPNSLSEITWETNLAASIERLETEIARLSSKLTVFKQIEQAIQNAGGWDNFKDIYAGELRKASASKQTHAD